MGIIMDNNINTKNNNEKSMKIIKIIIIMLVLLFFIAIATVCGIYYLKAKEFKFYVDGKLYSDVSENIVVSENGTTYVSIKDIAKYINYTPYNGEYSGNDRYQEDKTSCYLESYNEVVTYSLDSDIIYKSIVSEKSENGNSGVSNKLTTGNSDYEYYNIEHPVKMINDKLYCSVDAITLGTNIMFEYSKKDNTVKIYTLDTIISSYKNKVKDIAIADDTATFSNKKGILYDLVVVKNENNKYGVYSTSGQEIIGEKYAYIKFIEGSEEFIVLTDEGKMGIISNQGVTRINPNYDEIKKIDKEDELYLVSNNNKYGIVKKDDTPVIYLEYDEIGIDGSKYTNDNITNQYILFDNYIPVKKGDKWGILDKRGNEIISPTYDGFGCIAGTTNSRDANNLLILPEYEAIVAIKQNSYILVDMTGREIIPEGGYVQKDDGTTVAVKCNEVFSEISSGQKNYYVVYVEIDNNNNRSTNASIFKYDMLEFLRETMGILPIDERTIKIDNQNNNENNNEKNNEKSSNIETETSANVYDYEPAQDTENEDNQQNQDNSDYNQNQEEQQEEQYNQQQENQDSQDNYQQQDYQN